MRWRLVTLGLLLAFLVPSAAASTSEWFFRTPGGTAYCWNADGYRCMRPSDGLWIQLEDLAHGADVEKGSSAKYRGYRDDTVRVVPFGRSQISSDATVFQCWSRRSGLTCRHWQGLSFWLGPQRGHRIYYDAPGFRPHVQPLFHTAHGMRCGIARATLAPENPGLVCWRPADGVTLSISHNDGGQGGAHTRIEKARGYRPAGFTRLADGHSFAWRCRSVDREFAEHCSPTTGTPVFTCRSEPARLTCVNRKGRGFWASPHSFYAF